MAKILRGDIIWANLDPIQGREQAGLRPVLILSHDVFNEKSETVIAAALTSQPQKAGFPLTYPLREKHGSKSAWVKIGHIRTLSILRLGKKMGRVSMGELNSILEGLNEIIN